MSTCNSSSPVLTRPVNADNLEVELRIISFIYPKYPIVSLETEFAGITVGPGSDYNISRHLTPSGLYNLLKNTVKKYKLLQVGITLADADGNHVPYVWEFNFKDFDPSSDQYSVQWIESLKQKGIDLEKNHDFGIESLKFGEVFMSSGLVCNSEKVRWVAFHSGYDFGYLLKMLTGRDLPDHLPDFLLLLETFFGDNVYDVKHLVKHFTGFHGGLEQAAKILEVEPAAGKVQLAGGNSLLTWNVFQKIKDIFGGEPENFSGRIYGLN